MLQANRPASTFDSAPASFIGPDVSAIYFAGWNDTYNYPDGWTYYTRFQHRWSSQYNSGHFQGSGINSTAIMEAEIAAASAAGITAFCFDFYLPASVIEPDDPDPKHSALQAGLEAFLVASNNDLMKFWVNVIIDERFGLSYPASNNWKYLDALASYVANLMTNPRYHRINGLPALGMFGVGGGAAGPTISAAQWTQFLAPMGGKRAVYAVQTGNVSSAIATYDLQGFFAYGIQNLTPNQGQQPWTVMQGLDDNNTLSPPTGAFRVAQVTPANDGRALDTTTSSRTWIDQPTQVQLIQHLSNALRSRAHQLITLWNESAEEGLAFHPTTQEGTRYLDAMTDARTGRLRSSYTYKINAANSDAAIVESSGTWTYAGPLPTGVSGAHDADQVVSSETNAYKKLIHIRMTACDVYAETGPDCGVTEIYKDDVLDQTIDCYAASQTTSTRIATVTFSGPLVGHTVKALVKGTKNGSSSSVQIKLDYFKPTYTP